MIELIFNTEDIQAALEARFSFVCAMCKKLHGNRNGRDWTLTSCNSVYCCGPLGGGGYPEYSGPIKHTLRNFCFMCGKEQPEHIIKTKGYKANEAYHNILGCCEKHIELVHADFEIRAAGTRRPNKVRIAGHVVEL